MIPPSAVHDAGDPGAAAPGSGGATAPALGAWAVLLGDNLAKAICAFLLTLTVTALVPTVWGWSSYLVRSNSMEPSFAAGDVIAASPLASGDRVPIGRVMVFTDPARPGGATILIHRVVAAAGHGAYTTAGDANAANDTTPVPRSAFHARARLLIPYIGLPVVWFDAGRIVPLVGWLVLIAGAIVLVAFPLGERGTRRRRRSERSAAVPPGRPVAHPAARVLPHPRPGFVRAGAVFSVVIAVSASALQVVPALAAYSATARNSGNTWAAGPRLLQPYDAQVLGDAPYAYYLVDEPGGQIAVDASGNNRTGTYTAISAYHQPGGLPHNPGYSIALSGGGGRLVGGGAALADPTTFTLELWFKTTTIRGGKLIGFQSSQSATSSTYDRHVYMRTDGKLVYGGWANKGTSTITSPLPYNNGAWHYLVLTAVPGGNKQQSRMYVDGSLVASGNTTKTSSYFGWWRVGYGNLPTGAGYPPSADFTGAIDNVAVYPTALSDARIAAHYAAR